MLQNKIQLMIGSFCKVMCRHFFDASTKDRGAYYYILSNTKALNYNQHLGNLVEGTSQVPEYLSHNTEQSDACLLRKRFFDLHKIQDNFQEFCIIS